jgi:dephospho-CoA kinase
MVKVVAVCGMPGSGKGVFGDAAKQLGLIVRSMGDMIRAEVERRGIAGDPNVFGRVAQELRDEYGYGVLASRLIPIIEAEDPSEELVVIEGMRGIDEYDEFCAAWGDDFSVVAIVCDTDARFSRILARGRSEDGDRASFDERDAREIDWGVQTLIDNADHVINNSGSLPMFASICTGLLFELSA